MNLNKFLQARISDAVWDFVQRILDARYPLEYCKAYHGGTSQKQVIPNPFLATRYAKNADISYYRNYLLGRYPRPHYTGAYYCGYCDGWHLTTSPIREDFEEHQRSITEKAMREGNACEHRPRPGQSYTITFDFPDYTPEQIKEAEDRWRTRSEASSN